MGVPTHCSGAGNGVTGGDWFIYRPPPEHGRTIHCDLTFHGAVSGRREEPGDAPIQEILGAARPKYPGYKGGA